jgi:LPS-assembly protein
MADALATVGGPKFSVYGGYTYTTTNPFTLFDQPQPPAASSAYYVPRNEATIGFSARSGNYRLSGWARRDIQSRQMIATGVDAAYEDECYIFDLQFFHRYIPYNGDNGSTSVLLLVTFKTVGQFGYRAL